MKDRKFLMLLALIILITFGGGCTNIVTVYWSKPGAGSADLQKDKELCQSLQRAVGLNEKRIEKCLEAQGWSPVRQEKEATDSEAASSLEPSE